ncbi:ATP-grasp domain-containing protein [Mycobacterium aquaticum]|uniref:ATP-grasp domain-containing protein n=1 Tax=Mycobacterium aquaticum TaxID=1927124 RepID=UPI0009F19C7A|nr:hypothetical protein [Mycobacterium aquaticum]
MSVNAAIVTVADDIHALAVAHELRSRPGTECAIIEVDRLVNSGGFNWQAHVADSQVPSQPEPTHVANLDVIWWRRANAPDRADLSGLTPPQADVVRNDTKTSLRGILLTDFRGSWVSDPAATELADNKLSQLRVARDVGFTVPRTLVSNNPTAVRDFCDGLGNDVVVKLVHGSRAMGAIPTRMVTAEVLDDEASIRVAPTIYQQFVGGTHHLRAHVFGDNVYAAMLDSDRLDWRVDLTTPMANWAVPEKLRHMLCEVVRRLGLRMGIVDLKLDEDGDPVWLELNPQGQFLFVEALAGIPLTTLLANFLTSEAHRQRVEV